MHISFILPTLQYTRQNNLMKEFDQLETVLQQISGIQQLSVKFDESGKYLDQDKRELHLKGDVLKKWFYLNMEAKNLTKSIRYKLNHLV